MAGIFQTFSTSAMPKRLLRYALARFDIFEDEALDLENLDLGLGLRKSDLEFKDVGLKVDVRSVACDLFFLWASIRTEANAALLVETDQTTGPASRITHQEGQGIEPPDHRPHRCLHKLHPSHRDWRSHLSRAILHSSATETICTQGTVRRRTRH